MTWYIILFAICILGFVANNFFIKEEKWQKIINIVLIILLCITTGTRYNIGGYDYNVYDVVYTYTPYLKDFDFSTVHLINETFEIEKGFLFFISICKTIGFTYYGFNLICSIIFYTCFYFAFKDKTKQLSFIILFFLYKLFFFQTFVLTRQMLCLGLFFLMINFMRDGKFFKYLFCCLLASTIHASTFILIPVYFIRYLKITKKRLSILSLIFLPLTVISFFNIDILTVILKFIANIFGGNISTRLNNYITLLTGGSSINILNTIEYVLLIVLIILNYKYLKKNKKNDSIHIKLFIILLPILTIFRNYELLARIKDYFVITYVFLIIDLCEFTKISKNYKKYISYSVVILFCFAGYIRTLLVFDNGALLPYNSYINDNVKIFDWSNRK